MTTSHDIDLRQLVEDRLTGASSDLLREEPSSSRRIHTVPPRGDSVHGRPNGGE
ncbi:MAG: hypothetical protein WAW17_17080 [Rhodococcus sp. (in: high G+C Gram-positive bacteria)]|uniref:hypothetical protein n=1 Tax=Rhodococcus sp. TaxID=1831 RepID=UPI003BB19F06